MLITKIVLNFENNVEIVIPYNDTQVPIEQGKYFIQGWEHCSNLISALIYVGNDVYFMLNNKDI